MKTLVALIPCVALATVAHGALLLEENFNALTAGDLGGQNSWTANAALDVANGGLSYNNGAINIAGGARHATWSGIGNLTLGSKGFASQSSDVWFSLTINVTATNDSSRFWFYVSDDADLNDSGVMGQINTGSQALAAGSRIATSQSVSGNASLSVGNTIFIVGRFSQSSSGGTATIGDYDRMEMWVNPNSTTLGVALTATSTLGSAITTGIDTFGIATSGTGSTVLWDNLRIGTTQADVLDVYAIPEPSSFAALAGLGALGLVGLRRRSRR